MYHSAVLTLLESSSGELERTTGKGLSRIPLEGSEFVVIRGRVVPETESPWLSPLTSVVK